MPKPTLQAQSELEHVPRPQPTSSGALQLIDGSQSTAVSPPASPFVKWVGGKRSVLPQLLACAPPIFKRYWEPFVGGGALFFALRPRKASLSDNNLDLMITYEVVRDQPLELVGALRLHASLHSAEHYYKVRNMAGLTDSVQVAARFIYLNKTCYNGLYRVNRQGVFNVPMGRYVNPNIVAEENIHACSIELKGVGIEFGEFDRIAPTRGDFVYCDPPYHPTDETSFTSYTKLDFTERDQLRLSNFASRMDKKGVMVMLSNSNTRFIREIYGKGGFRLRTVDAPRLVNCKPDARGTVSELIITNY